MHHRRIRQRAPFGMLLTGIGTGAWLEYLFDPDRGRTRRAEATARLHRHARALERGSRVFTLRALGRSKGVLHDLQPPAPAEPLNEADLAHKVQTVLFRDVRFPKGSINVNAEGSTVFLRGEVGSTELIAEIDEAAKKIPGVGMVTNLLHVPGSPAPHAKPANFTRPGGTAISA